MLRRGEDRIDGGLTDEGVVQQLGIVEDTGDVVDREVSVPLQFGGEGVGRTEVQCGLVVTGEGAEGG